MKRICGRPAAQIAYRHVIATFEQSCLHAYLTKGAKQMECLKTLYEFASDHMMDLCQPAHIALASCFGIFVAHNWLVEVQKHIADIEKQCKTLYGAYEVLSALYSRLASELYAHVPERVIFEEWDGMIHSRTLSTAMEALQKAGALEIVHNEYGKMLVGTFAGELAYVLYTPRNPEA